MKRVLEPELMSDKQQAIAYANANFEEPHNHFLELLKYSIEKKSTFSGDVIDLGTGAADIAIRLANSYPTFNIDAIDGSIAMLEEVLERRLVKLDNENEWINPDIIIIDGGKGHLNIAKKIINKNRKSKIELIAIAKGKDRNSGREIIYYNNEYKILDKKDEFSHFIQKIRDEAHRFAINSHRKRRSKDTIKSVFDEINGIGTIRKKILLEHFGSIKNIRCAKVNELYKDYLFNYH